MEKEASDFLRKVIQNGKFKGRYEKVINNHYNIDDYIEIYEYPLDEKLYDIVILKEDKRIKNYFIKVII